MPRIEIEIPDWWELSVEPFLARGPARRGGGRPQWHASPERRRGDVSGAYALWLGDKCMYVGSSVNSMSIRIAVHHKNGIVFDRVGFYPCPHEDCIVVECALIAFLRPVGNRGIPGSIKSPIKIPDPPRVERTPAQREADLAEYMVFKAEKEADQKRRYAERARARRLERRCDEAERRVVHMI